MVGLKKKSKRITTKRRVKIEKKVRQHNKKQRKEANKNPNKRKKKDPGIPNSLPFKETVLKEIEDRQRRLAEEREKQKQKRKKEREKLQNKNRNLEDLVKDANKRQQEFEKKNKVKEARNVSAKGKKSEGSLKAYFKEFRKVVDAADVVLEVLDARDPLGSRCQDLESSVLSTSTNKKLVLVLNKIDLVPKENVEAWLKYLRNELPTVAFKASTQTQNDHLSQKKLSLALASSNLMKSSHCLGADILMKLLGNYCRNQDVRTIIRVGVVGFPNTGKSSVINSLKRARACNVGATPGVTKVMQEVQLDKHIRLLDSPGVVMATDQSQTAAVLRNVVKLETVEDPIPAVDSILKRCSKQQLMLHYNLSDFKNTDEFVALLAQKHGQLRKGGVPDCNRAARTVLQDWTCGRITFYTHPPELHTLPTHVSATIIAEMSKAFDIDSLLADEAKILNNLETKKSNHMLVDSIGPALAILEEKDLPNEPESEEMLDDKDVQGGGEEEEEEEKMVEDNETGTDKELMGVTVSMPSKIKASLEPSDSSPFSGTSSISTGRTKRAETSQPSGSGLIPDNRQANKARLKAYKKMKKDRKRSDALAGTLANALDSAFSVGLGDIGENDNDYDFSKDFT